MGNCFWKKLVGEADNTNLPILGVMENADLSAVNTQGFIIPENHNINASAGWSYGRIPVPEGAKEIYFNDLPSAEYSASVCSYFVDENGNYIGTSLYDSNIFGNEYLGAGNVKKSVPENAVALMFCGKTSAIPNYDIQFYVE